MLRGKRSGCSSEGRCARQHHLQPVSARPPTAHALKLHNVSSRRTSRLTNRVQRARERLISLRAGASRRRASTADTKISSADEATPQKLRRTTCRWMTQAVKNEVVRDAVVSYARFRLVASTRSASSNAARARNQNGVRTEILPAAARSG